MKEVECVASAVGIARVERTNAIDGCFDDGGVALERFGGRVSEIAQDSEVEMRISIGEELDFEILERVVDGVDAAAGTPPGLRGR